MEKEGEKIIFVGVGWREERKENRWNEGVFFLDPPKYFLSKSRKILERKRLPTCVDERTNVQSAHVLSFSSLASFFLFWFSSLVFVFFRTSHFFFSSILDALTCALSYKLKRKKKFEVSIHNCFNRKKGVTFCFI